MKTENNKERNAKIEFFLKMNGGIIDGKEEECIRFIEGMSDGEAFNPSSLAGKISRLRVSIKNLKNMPASTLFDNHKLFHHRITWQKRLIRKKN